MLNSLRQSYIPLLQKVVSDLQDYMVRQKNISTGSLCWLTQGTCSLLFIVVRIRIIKTCFCVPMSHMTPTVELHSPSRLQSVGHL